VSFRDKTFLCIIPARAGSKRLKNKNLLNLCGKSLIHWSIKAAKEAGIFDKIVLLSDSKAACDYAIEMGVSAIAEPAELASDTAYVGDAIIDLLMSGVVAGYDYVQLVEPTSPLLRGTMLKNAAQYCIDKDADFVISMCEAEAPNGMAKPISNNLCVTDWWPEKLFGTRSQDCPAAYRVDGLIYLGKWDTWLRRNYWKSKIFAYITDKNDSVDINDVRDFSRAEAVLSHRLKRRAF